MKKAEHWIIDAFELLCWRRFWESLGQGGDKNQSILKEINPEYSLERLMMKLKLQHLPTDAKSQITGKDPDAG